MAMPAGTKRETKGVSIILLTQSIVQNSSDDH